MNAHIQVTNRKRRVGCAMLLCLSMVNPGSLMRAQDQIATPQKYKLTVMTDAATMKRGKKGRVSSQAVVKVTDENNVPVAGIAVTFTIPQFIGGASFANGALTSMVTTNAAGLASSSLAATTGASFTVTASAAVPGGVISAAIPVNTAAIAAGGSAAGGTAGAASGAAGGGLSTGAIVGIVAGVAAAAVGVGVGVGMKGGDSPTVSAIPRGTIAGPGGPVIGPPR